MIWQRISCPGSVSNQFLSDYSPDQLLLDKYATAAGRSLKTAAGALAKADKSPELTLSRPSVASESIFSRETLQVLSYKLSVLYPSLVLWSESNPVGFIPPENLYGFLQNACKISTFQIQLWPCCTWHLRTLRVRSTFIKQRYAPSPRSVINYPTASVGPIQPAPPVTAVRDPRPL